MPREAGFFEEGFDPGLSWLTLTLPEGSRPAEVEAALKASTSRTQKGEYRKLRHGTPILESLDPERVRARAPHCARLFKTLAEALA